MIGPKIVALSTEGEDLGIFDDANEAAVALWGKSEWSGEVNESARLGRPRQGIQFHYSYEPLDQALSLPVPEICKCSKTSQVRS